MERLLYFFVIASLSTPAKEREKEIRMRKEDKKDEEDEEGRGKENKE